jgi:hypothetical protein
MTWSDISLLIAIAAFTFSLVGLFFAMVSR